MGIRKVKRVQSEKSKGVKYLLRIAFIVFITSQLSFAQDTKSAFSFCGKTGDCTMTYNELMACKKELTALDKGASVSYFIITLKVKEKKDFVFVEYTQQGNRFTKGAMEAIEKLHKEKKLGDKLEIGSVEIVQSGKAAKQVPGMVITLN